MLFFLGDVLHLLLLFFPLSVQSGDVVLYIVKLFGQDFSARCKILILLFIVLVWYRSGNYEMRTMVYYRKI